MKDEARAANAEIRPHFRKAGISEWGPFFFGRSELQREDFFTAGWNFGVYVFPGVSIMFTVTTTT
jgi:hypothetical protein